MVIRMPFTTRQADKGRADRLQEKKSPPALIELGRAKGGGARRDRTADLLHAMQALSQLSYGPNRWKLSNRYSEFWELYSDRRILR
jgi:hypothetical protein